MKLIKDEKRKGMYYFYCPGCKCAHYLATSENDCGFPTWKWNGDVEKPTISPSVKITCSVDPKVCHSFIRDGKIQYLSDCTHELAGKTVDMIDWDDL